MQPQGSPWLAPYVDRPVRAYVEAPPSKSVTNRALVLAALADGPSTVIRPLVARDTTLMTAALSGLGTRIEPSDGGVHVTPAALRGPAAIDCGLAGTVMRFVPPLAAMARGTVHFDGDARARERPLRTLLGALRDLGATIPGTADALPFTIQGHGAVKGGVVEIDASASSQFVSGLLLAGANYEYGVDVRHNGTPIPSQPHIDMTVAMLRERGVAVDTAEPNRWAVSPGPIHAVPVTVEPDLSNAAAFLAAAVATGGEVTVAAWPEQTTQPGDRIRTILPMFGARTRLFDDGLTVTGPETVTGVDVDLHDVGELTPVIAALAAVADSPSHLHGIGHLRGHETDRLAALATELRRLGGAVEETADGLRITPAALHGTTMHTYGDHRMAHAAAVLGLVVENLYVDDITVTTKTQPGFASDWQAMLQGPVPA